MLTKVLVLERVQGAAGLRRTTDCPSVSKRKECKTVSCPCGKNIQRVQNPKLIIFLLFFFIFFFFIFFLHKCLEHELPESSVNNSSSQGLTVCSLADPCLWYCNHNLQDLHGMPSLLTTPAWKLSPQHPMRPLLESG